MPNENIPHETDLESVLSIQQSGTDRNQAGTVRTISSNSEVVRPPGEEPPSPTPPPTEPPKPKAALRYS